MIFQKFCGDRYPSGLIFLSRGIFWEQGDRSSSLEQTKHTAIDPDIFWEKSHSDSTFVKKYYENPEFCIKMTVFSRTDYR